MSFSLLLQAWKTDCGSHTKKVVLACLASHADEAGLSWPSIQTICSECNLSERAVQTQIGLLADDELIRVERRGGKHLSNRYWVARNPAPDTVHGVHPRTPNGVSHAPNPAGRAPNPAPAAPQLSGIRKELKGEGKPSKIYPNELKDQIKSISDEIQRLTDFGRTDEDKAERSKLIARRKELRTRYHYT